MVSEFRQKKLTHLFNFFDSNGSGNIDKADFELAAEKINQSRGWGAGDAKNKEVTDTLLQIWSGIQSQADADGDGQVTNDEWISMWVNYAKNPSTPQEWQNTYCKFIFSIQDASNDGSIDSEEFASVNVSLGRSRDEAVQAFKKMSRGNSSVSWAEFQALWREYFTSDDPNAAGNFIFGRTSF